MQNPEKNKKLKRLSHIAIIMDGNGRWAKSKGLVRSKGHLEGAATFKKIALYCSRINLPILTVYAFSTENWKRPKPEVNFLINLFKNQLKQALKDFSDSNIRVNFIGNIKKFPTELINLIRKTEETSKKFTGMILNIALNYGSRSEIINATRQILTDLNENKIYLNDISEEVFKNYLFTENQDDPDVIIRTGGEFRLSNFLLWQGAYSELFFTKTLWPDFSEKELDNIINEYYTRKRRYGGL